MKSGNLNFLEPSGPLQACNGNVLLLLVNNLFVHLYQVNNVLNDSLFYEFDAQILYFTTFIVLLYMFRALLCSSSGEQLY